MKKTKYLSLLVLPLLLVACGETSSTPTPSSSEPTTSEGTSSESSSSSSTSENTAQKEVDEKVGTFELLKGVLSSYEGVSKVITTSIEGETTTTDTLTIKTREVLQISETEKETTTIYNGYVDGAKYYASIDSYPYVEREKVYADGTEGLSYRDKTESQVLEQLNKTIKSASDVTSGIWANFFTATQEQTYGTTGTSISSYSATLKDNEIEIRAKGYENQYKTAYGDNGLEYTFNGANEYTFVAYLDANYILKTGNLTCKYYNTEGCDTTTKLPLESATATSTSKYNVTSFEAGNREETGTTPLYEDISNYFMTSITDKAYYQANLGYDSSWNTIFGNKNEAFLGSTIESYNIKTFESNDNGDITDKYFLPATATDRDDFKIIASSSPAIAQDEYGSWTVSSDTSYIGTSVTLTLGNDFVANLGTITLTIAQDPNAGGSSGDSGTTTDGTEININFDETEPYFINNTGTFDFFSGITLTSNETSYLVIPATNDGPYTNYGNDYFAISGDDSICEAEFDYAYGNENNINGMIIKFTAKTTGTTTFELFLGWNDDPSWSCNLSCNLGGGSSTKNLPTIDWTAAPQFIGEVYKGETIVKDGDYYQINLKVDTSYFILIPATSTYGDTYYDDYSTEYIAWLNASPTAGTFQTDYTTAKNVYTEDMYGGLNGILISIHTGMGIWSTSLSIYDSSYSAEYTHYFINITE